MANRSPLSFSLISLLDQRGPMRPVAQIVLGEGPLHQMVLDQPMVGKHQEVARGVGGFVHTILLAGIARAAKVHAQPVACHADGRRHAPLHPGDRIGNGATFLCRTVVAADAGHESGDFRNVAWREGVGRLQLAAIGVADGDRVGLRRLRGKLLEMSFRRPVLLIDATPQKGEHEANKPCEGAENARH